MTRTSAVSVRAWAESAAGGGVSAGAVAASGALDGAGDGVSSVVRDRRRRVGGLVGLREARHEQGRGHDGAGDFQCSLHTPIMLHPGDGGGQSVVFEHGFEQCGP